MTVASRRRVAAVATAAVLTLGFGTIAASAASVNASPATTRDVTGFGTTRYLAEQNFYAVAASYGYTKAQCTLTDVDHADSSVQWWATGYCTN